MNTDIKYSTLENVEVGEVFIINIKATIYLGWRKEEFFYQSIDSNGKTGAFIMDALDMEDNVIIVGNTTSLTEVQRLAPWFVGEHSSPKITNTTFGLSALQSMAAVKTAMHCAEVARNTITKDLSESL